MNELDRLVAVRYGTGAHQHLRGGLVGKYERMQDYREVARGKGPLARVANMAYCQMTGQRIRPL